MIDGRTAAALSRVLAHVEQLGGELVLTKDRGRWQVQAVIGGSTLPAADRDIAFGHGTLFEGLHHVGTELNLPHPAGQLRGQLTVGNLGGPPAPRTAGMPSRQPFSGAT